MPNAAAKKPSFPLCGVKSVAQMADEYFKLRNKRYAMQKEVDEVHAQETSLRTRITELLTKDKNTTGVSGKLCHAQLVDKEKITVDDWDKVYKYIAKTKSFDLLQRRLSDEAVKARWSEDEVIPGVNKLRFKDLSISKVK